MIWRKFREINFFNFSKILLKESGVGGYVETLYIHIVVDWWKFREINFIHYYINWCHITTVWKSWKFSLKLFGQKFRESTVCTKYTKELISRTILFSTFFLLRKFRQIQDFYCKLISRIKLVDVYLAIRYISVRPHFCRVNGHMVEPYPLHIWSIYIRWFWNGTMLYFIDH